MEFENFNSVKARAVQHARGEKGVDFGIHVLEARIGQHDRRRRVVRRPTELRRVQGHHDVRGVAEP